MGGGEGGVDKKNPDWHDGKVEDWEGLAWGLRKKQWGSGVLLGAEPDRQPCATPVPLGIPRWEPSGGSLILGIQAFHFTHTTIIVMCYVFLSVLCILQ